MSETVASLQTPSAAYGSISGVDAMVRDQSSTDDSGIPWKGIEGGELSWGRVRGKRRWERATYMECHNLTLFGRESAPCIQNSLAGSGEGRGLEIDRMIGTIHRERAQKNGKEKSPPFGRSNQKGSKTIEPTAQRGARNSQEWVRI